MNILPGTYYWTVVIPPIPAEYMTYVMQFQTGKYPRWVPVFHGISKIQISSLFYIRLNLKIEIVENWENPLKIYLFIQFWWYQGEIWTQYFCNECKKCLIFCCSGVKNYNSGQGGVSKKPLKWPTIKNSKIWLRHFFALITEIMCPSLILLP